MFHTNHHMKPTIEEIAAKHGLTEGELKVVAASAIGRLGGSSGTGEAKRRPDAHYAKMVAARNKQRARAKKAKKNE